MFAVHNVFKHFINNATGEQGITFLNKGVSRF